MTDVITIDAAPVATTSKLTPRVNASRFLNRYLGPAKAYHSNLVLLERQKGRNPFDLSIASKVRPRALRRYHDIPPLEHLNALRDEFWKAATQPVDEATARALIGVMLDGLRVRPSDSTATYIDLLVDGLTDEISSLERKDYVLSCSSPFAVSWMVRTIVRETKFQPDISDVLGICRKHMWQFREAAMGMESLIELRENAEDILTITGDLIDDGQEIPF